MKIFDTHAHYNDGRFNDYEGGMDKAIRDSYEVGVCGFINCGTCPDSSRRSIEIARQYENAYAAVGIHPESAEELRKLCSFEIVNDGICDIDSQIADFLNKYSLEVRCEKE